MTATIKLRSRATVTRKHCDELRRENEQLRQTLATIEASRIELARKLTVAESKYAYIRKVLDGKGAEA